MWATIPLSQAYVWDQPILQWTLSVKERMGEGHLEVVQEISAGHGPSREEVLGHPVILTLHLQQHLIHSPSTSEAARLLLTYNVPATRHALWQTHPLSQDSSGLTTGSQIPNQMTACTSKW